MDSIAAQIVVYQGTQQIADHSFTAAQLKGGIKIGADKASDLRLEANTVSSYHAELRERVGQIQLTRQSATNPVVVAGHTLAHRESITLIGQTEITIVPFRLVFTLAGGQQPAPRGPTAPTRMAPPPSAPIPTVRSPVLPLAPTVIALDPDRTIIWPIAEDQPGRYLYDLPMIFRDLPSLSEDRDTPTKPTAQRQADGDRYIDPDDGLFLGQYLKIFEAIWEPIEQRQDHIEAYFDPRTCPESMLDLLTHWSGVDHYPGLTLEQRRSLLTKASIYSQYRGTRLGLRLAIKACTGLDVRIEDVIGQPYLFRVALAPVDATLRSLIEQIIQIYQPAYMGYYLE
jgi:phage tail-like protein